MLSNNRHGAKLRKLFRAAAENQRKRYECTKCGKKNVRRKGYAQWQCRSCDTRFAGGAYTFQTETGSIALRMLREYAE